MRSTWFSSDAFLKNFWASDLEMECGGGTPLLAVIRLWEISFLLLDFRHILYCKKEALFDISSYLLDNYNIFAIFFLKFKILIRTKHTKEIIEIFVHFIWGKMMEFIEELYIQRRKVKESNNVYVIIKLL